MSVVGSPGLLGDVGPSEGGLAAARPSTRPRIVSVVEGWFGVVVGLVGSSIIAVVSVIDRALVVPALYEATSDLLVHLAAEIVAAGCLWLLLRAGLEVVLRLNQAFPGSARARRQAQKIVALLAGVLLAAGLYEFVISRSSRSAMLPLAGWGAVLLAVGCGGTFALYAVSRARLPSRAPIYGVAPLVVAVAIHLWAVHHYLRHYGNLHSLIIVAAILLAAVGAGCVLCGAGPRTRFRLGAAIAAVLVCALVTLMVVSPSYSSRRAVLVWGGVAKRLLVALAWPVLDRDGDGAPSVLWGADPDDRDARATALSSGTAVREPRQLLTIPELPTRRNLLWVFVDTVRSDSFEQLLSEGRAQALSEFAYFADYRSCSSRTEQVMTQLLGRDHCDPRTSAALEAQSLLEALQSKGYHDHLIGYFRLPLPFTSAEAIMDDSAILARARDRLSRALPEPQALFVHLRGGHGPYRSPGGSERERYEATLRRSFEQVEQLVTLAPDGWVVVVMGDHGEEFGEHGSHAHATTLYEEVLRTPFLIRAPGLKSGLHRGIFGCPDARWKVLAATGVLKEAPAPLSFHYAGVDISRGEFGYLRDEEIRSLSIGQKKAIWSPGLGIWELYDLASDRLEQRSLAQRDPELLQSMQAELTRWVRRCGKLARTAKR